MLNSYTLQNMADMILKYTYLMPYRKLGKCKYEIYCTRCGKYEVVDYDTLLQIRECDMCPMCLNSIRLVKHSNLAPYEFIRLKNDGFFVKVEWSMHKRPKVVSYFKVAEWKINSNNTEVIRTIGISRPQNYYTNHLVLNSYYSNWSNWKNYEKYGHWFYSYEQYMNEFPNNRSLKDYYESMNEHNVYPQLLKSNQIKILKDNMLSIEQVQAIYMFDLKSWDEIKKYRKYIRLYCRHTIIKEPLNIYYLDYLYRNNIPLYEFGDYIRQCKTLNLKIDKPKDFNKAHNKLSEIIEVKKDELILAGCVERFKELSKYQYKKGNITIKPYANSEEIIKQSKKTFKNCMAECYMEDYSNGQTDLYHLDIDNKPKVAIEIRDNCLEQALIKCNKDCPKDLLNIIKGWCRNNKWQISPEYC